MQQVKVKLIYETSLILLALTSVLFLVFDLSYQPVIDKVIWAVFFIDVIIRITISKNKWGYIKTHPLDLVAAIPLGGMFQMARLARLLMVLRVFAISKNYFKTFFSVLKTNNLDRVFTISVVLLFLSTVLIRYFEPGINSYGDGLWWSIVTTTTVGYGDISPASIGGRVIAVVLILVGIGLIGMLTGSITTYFVKERKSKHPTVQFVQKELDRYEELNADDMHRLSVVLEELSHEKKP